MATIMIVDDEFSVRRTLGMYLDLEGFRILEAADVPQARELLAANRVDVLVTDMRLGNDAGTSLLTFLREQGSDTGSIVMTGYGSIESAVEAMRLGAFDYLTKPVNPDELVLRVRKLLEQRSLREEVMRLRDQLAGQSKLAHVVARSQAMQDILGVIERIRQRDIPVLITGETGTGKEVLATALHQTSSRADKAYITVNCATLPEDLLDSELFGHMKGAFTGAVSNARGLFQQADGGTLFLDEIGDVSPRLQAKLLRVLQEGEVRPLGGERTLTVDVRVIAATNRDLGAMVCAGEFREDLFFRLNVLPIHIPPLRERREDIPALAESFVARVRAQYERPELGLSQDAIRKLAAHDWPGNIRQLQNVIERSFALHPGPVLRAQEVLITTGSGAGPADEPEHLLPLAQVERRHIRRVLAAHNGNQVASARVLGIGRSTLRRKLEEDG
ncbi:sigma-54-dependent transcriptional regulator [Thioalkalivibrio thiocyanodenitrificans]|uniref:sigma-54-dependent transcriptional regulator n=1 Tax=Thioalkalivibrio thiocyanodenitrificans TaxID=243063 RepID=UPI00036B2D56|nr:sigma-54 dependent transcriptional regulator [Thioalkalivibrio thiocyanodenitrificans]